MTKTFACYWVTAYSKIIEIRVSGKPSVSLVSFISQPGDDPLRPEARFKNALQILAFSKKTLPENLKAFNMTVMSYKRCPVQSEWVRDRGL